MRFRSGFILTENSCHYDQFIIKLLEPIFFHDVNPGKMQLNEFGSVMLKVSLGATIISSIHTVATYREKSGGSPRTKIEVLFTVTRVPNIKDIRDRAGLLKKRVK